MTEERLRELVILATAVGACRVDAEERRARGVCVVRHAHGGEPVAHIAPTLRLMDDAGAFFAAAPDIVFEFVAEVRRLQEALAAERERCAKAAESVAAGLGGDYYGAEAVGAAIAKALREGRQS